MNTHRLRPFAQVDVFSKQPFQGNPVAVIIDASNLSDEDMARIARWTNLSETTFILPPTVDAADYRLRIFTPTGELPFAGHPTLGSARAWLANGGTPQAPNRITQECAAGLVDIRIEDNQLAFAAPPLVRTGPLDEDYLDRIAAAFDISRAQIVDHQWVDNGPGWAVVQLNSAEEVLALNPDFSVIPDAKVGAVGAYPEGSPHAFELRAFAPAMGVPEDPVTGSLNASVAQWLTGVGRAPKRYTVAQGACLGCSGEITINVDGDTIWVGGEAQVLFQGEAFA